MATAGGHELDLAAGRELLELGVLADRQGKRGGTAAASGQPPCLRRQAVRAAASSARSVCLAAFTVAW